VLFCVTNSRSQSAVPESDTQSWNDLQVTIPLSKKAEFVIIGTLRIGDNLTKFVDEREGFRSITRSRNTSPCRPYTFIAMQRRQMHDLSGKSESLWAQTFGSR
jgi:hypothetical protein